MRALLAAVTVSLVWAGAALGTELARGIVFEDRNGNGVRDADEPGLRGVLVSNGVDVVKTDGDGRYEVSVDNDTIIFVIKPSRFATPVCELNLPRFYYIHKPDGSPDAEYIYKGVAPTGAFPESIDFALRRDREEQEEFDVVLIGDPQPYSNKEVSFYARDTIAELIADGWGERASFAIVLGDLVGDYLELYEGYNAVNAQVGIPFYNILGNHDLNFKSATDEHSDETFERVFGPATYAFQYGRAHFIVLDDVIYQGFDGLRDDGFPKTGNYRGGLREDQLRFIENFLKHVPREDLVVLCMHIPLEGGGVHRVPEQAELFRILSNHPNTVSFSGHTHWQQHWFFGSEHGYAAGTDHHHLNCATASGSWYRGAFDELGIPVSTMRCGSPSGYNILSIDGNRYTTRFKATRRPANHQMHIHLPESVSGSSDDAGEVVVNVFAGSEKCRVEMRIGDGKWTAMRFEPRLDPFMVEAKALEEGERIPTGRPLPDPQMSHHIWVAEIPSGLASGMHRIEVRWVDLYGQTHRGWRLLRVE